MRLQLTATLCAGAVQGAYCWDADNNQYIDYGALHSAREHEAGCTAAVESSACFCSSMPLAPWAALPEDILFP